MPPEPCQPASSAPPIAVLDTNVVLDLLAFADARAKRLDDTLSTGGLVWLATQPMLDELADVLQRPFLARWQVDAGAVLAAAQARCRIVDAVAADGAPAPRCADPDDQKFIDLAWAWPAAWLFSRDRALLDLARPARARGVGITTPVAWPGLAAPAGQT